MRPAGPPPTISGRGAILALLAIVLVLIPAGAVAANGTTGRGLAPSSGPVATPIDAAAHAPTAPVRAAISSGPGTFFINTPIPLPASRTVFHGSGVSSGAAANITNEPSINYTSKGVLALAYTAMTNASPCANLSGTAASEVGFVRSTNQGTSWSTPVYLGDTNCTDGPKFASAWEPSLTSLSNGTLALVFIEYNLTQPQYYPAYIPYAFETNTPSSRLVFTESYDGGVTWGTPVALNTSVAATNGTLVTYPPQRPWISAVNNTIFVTWENLTRSPLYPQSYYPNLGGGPSIGSHLVVSKNGGSTWGTPIDLPVTTGRVYPFATSVAMNPTVLAVPNGTVYVSYTTNVSYALPCATICLQNPTITADVVVGGSTDDGATFHWATIARTLATTYYSGGWGPFVDPSPQLASSPTNGQLYVTFAASLPGVYCYPGTPRQCFPSSYGEGIFFANSSRGGWGWSAAHLVDPALIDGNNGPPNVNYNPSVIVDGKGVVHVEMTYSQYQGCPTTCILQKQLYYNSTDNGTTFSGGFVLSGNYTYNPYQWDGEYDTMAAAGSHLWIAYVQDLCPAWTTQTCNMYTSSSGRAQVTVASPYRGTGVTLTFSERGLPVGANWTVNVLGNVRSAAAGSTVSVSGVPTAQPINWSLPWTNASYGTAYVGTMAAGTAYNFTASTALTVNYGELVRVEVTTLPVFNPCYFLTCLNWVLPPTGVSWDPVGTSVSVSVSNVSVSCGPPFGCSYVNASFLGWSGTGNGSVTSGAYAITFTANGPVNETANFLPTAYCSGYTTVTCNSGATYQIEFHQTGLPSGVSWSVSADGITGTSNNNTLTLLMPNGTVQWTASAVPDGTTNVWVANSTSSSIVQVPYTSQVNLTYTRQTLSSQRFPVQVNAIGLPPGSTWTANFSGALSTFSQPNGTTTVAAGSYTLGLGPVYSENGTRFAATSFEVVPYVTNLSTSNYTGASARVSIDGPTSIYAQYQENVRVAVQAGAGGNATAAQTWVVPGTGVTLHETPDPGYVFAGWQGFGSGATSGAQDTQSAPTIFPTGPVTEVATFFRPPTPEYSVTIHASGLPAQQTFTVSLGPTSASGTDGVAVIAGLTSGWFSLRVPLVVSNASVGSEYSLSSATGSAGVVANANGTVQVTGNGSLLLTFGAQFEVVTAAVGPGSIGGPSASSWESAGTVFTATAVPGTGDRFLGWAGDGIGAYTGRNLTFSVTVAGPISEVATFAPPPPPRTFNLTLTESGLPTGLVWAFALGTAGASGPPGSLTLGGLNGSYVLNIPWTAGTTDGTRWVANLSANQTVGVTADRSLTLTFTEQVRLAVGSTEGGSVTPSGDSWYARGAVVALSASPATGQTFVGWSGTGAPSYSGTNASTSVTLTAPASELATFAPVPPTPAKSASSNSLSGLPIAIGSFVALLVVGAIVAALFARRRPPSAGSPSTEQPPTGELATEAETDSGA